MASATKSSPFESITVQDDSFYTYLSFIGQSFSNDLTNSSRRTSFQTIAPPSSNRISGDNYGELDVFSAEKYFSGILDENYTYDYGTEFMYDDKNKKKKNKRKMRLSMSTFSETSQSHLLRRQQQQQQQKPPSNSDALRRVSYLDIFCCYCSKKNDVVVKDDADMFCSDKSSSNKLPSCDRKSSTIMDLGRGYLWSYPSSDLFEIDTIMSMNSQSVHGHSTEGSIEWSDVATASASNLTMTTNN